jgi:DNA-binding Lrp family transcriptional regulator
VTSLPSAYVLINVEANMEDSVLKDLKTMPEIIEAYVSYGVYDLIVKVRTENIETLKEIVTYKIRSIKNVRKTLTLIAQ